MLLSMSQRRCHGHQHASQSLTCDADAGVEAGAHVRLAELAADHMCVAHVAVAALLRRLGKRRRPLLLCRIFAVCLLRWPACRSAAMR